MQYVDYEYWPNPLPPPENNYPHVIKTKIPNIFAVDNQTCLQYRQQSSWQQAAGYDITMPFSRALHIITSERRYMQFCEQQLVYRLAAESAVNSLVEVKINTIQDRTKKLLKHINMKEIFKIMIQTKSNHFINPNRKNDKKMTKGDWKILISVIPWTIKQLDCYNADELKQISSKCGIDDISFQHAITKYLDHINQMTNKIHNHYPSGTVKPRIWTGNITTKVHVPVHSNFYLTNLINQNASVFFPNIYVTAFMGQKLDYEIRQIFENPNYYDRFAKELKYDVLFQFDLGGNIQFHINHEDEFRPGKFIPYVKFTR